MNDNGEEDRPKSPAKEGGAKSPRGRRSHKAGEGAKSPRPRRSSNKSNSQQRVHAEEEQPAVAVPSGAPPTETERREALREGPRGGARPDGRGAVEVARDVRGTHTQTRAGGRQCSGRERHTKEENGKRCVVWSLQAGEGSWRHSAFEG